jgi:hypothetical protein
MNNELNEEGWIYCMSNSPNLYKIGYTINDPEKRRIELSSSSGVPLPFELIFAKKVKNYKNKEKQIHSFLENYFPNSRINSRREFFIININTIFDLFNMIDGEWYKKECKQIQKDYNKEIDDQEMEIVLNNYFTIDFSYTSTSYLIESIELYDFQYKNFVVEICKKLSINTTNKDIKDIIKEIAFKSEAYQNYLDQIKKYEKIWKIFKKCLEDENEKYDEKTIEILFENYLKYKKYEKRIKEKFKKCLEYENEKYDEETIEILWENYSENKKKHKK